MGIILIPLLFFRMENVYLRSQPLRKTKPLKIFPYFSQTFWEGCGAGNCSETSSYSCIKKKSLRFTVYHISTNNRRWTSPIKQKAGLVIFELRTFFKKLAAKFRICHLTLSKVLGYSKKLLTNTKGNDTEIFRVKKCFFWM